MNRRRFLSRTSAGLSAVLISPGNWSFGNELKKPKSYPFRPYRKGKTVGNVQIITPNDGFYTNTYYDVCPWSPSQRYLAVTKMPYQDQITLLGDIAEVCIIDLEEQSIRSVYQTKVWGYQLGANIHWGNSDRYVFTNDLIDGENAVCVRIDLETGETKAYEGPKYDINKERTTVIGPNLELLNTTQYAYGTPAKKADRKSFDTLPPGASSKEGLWSTDLNYNEKKLLVSLEQAANSLEEQAYYKGGTFYFYHTKYNSTNDKILLVLRCTFPGGNQYTDKDSRNPSLLTVNADGQNMKTAVTREQWSYGGHHPTWHPGGDHIIMNLTPKWLGEEKLRFCQFRPDGSDFKILSQKFLGSGHPSITPDSRYILSDAYPFEKMAMGNGEVPIRLIDLQNDREHTICTVYTDLGEKYKVSRFWGPSKLDAHPVWDKSYKKVCFNGAPEGNRAVLVADLAHLIYK